MLEEVLKEHAEEVRKNTVALTHLIALLTKTGVQGPAVAHTGPGTESPQEPEAPISYPDDERRNAKLDITHNYIPEVPEGTDVKLVPKVRGSSGLPEGERDKAYYETHIRPKIAELAKINVKEVKKIFAFYEFEAKKEGREFKDLSAVPQQQWDELYGRVLMEIHRTENPEELREQVAEARANAEAEIAKAEEAAKPVLPEGERDVVFYAKYVRTEFMELVKLSPEKAKAIVASYGVAKADQIPASEWENVVLAVRAEIANIKAGG
jgi:hypothetical protein